MSQVTANPVLHHFRTVLPGRAYDAKACSTRFKFWKPSKIDGLQVEKDPLPAATAETMSMISWPPLLKEAADKAISTFNLHHPTEQVVDPSPNPPSLQNGSSERAVYCSSMHSMALWLSLHSMVL